MGNCKKFSGNTGLGLVKYENLIQLRVEWLTTQGMFLFNFRSKLQNMSQLLTIQMCERMVYRPIRSLVPSGLLLKP